jgi:CheY-like chemotaxis protein
VTAHEYILVVEDDDRVRDVLRILLEAEGFGVASARNGQEALERLTRQQPPFVILLDLVMPVMNGWQFCHEQRRAPHLAGIPVLLLSAEPDLDRTATSLGAAACFPKPVEFDRLLATVRTLAELPHHPP